MRWVQGRKINGTESLRSSLTEMPKGTPNCGYEHAEQNLSVWASDPPYRKLKREASLRIMHQRCAGLDVHKRTVVACRLRLNEPGAVEREVRTFGTTTSALLLLVDWLLAWGLTQVALESTGEYWKPVYNLLEGNMNVVLVNAQHVKHVPGRKTDVQDAEWLAEWLSYGLLKPSFIPAKPPCDLRDLTRYRTTLVEERARLVNRVQKLLGPRGRPANIKLASVATDVLGVSGRRMLAALVAGQSDPTALAELAKGRLRTKLPPLHQALTGVVDEHHRYLLAQQRAHIDFLDEQIDDFAQEIGRRLAQMSQPTPPTAAGDPAQPDPPASASLTWQQAITLLDSAPGVDTKAAEAVLAEMGIHRRQFPSANHLAAWAGVAPGNHQSGGKWHSSRIRNGNRTLRTLLIQIAWAAVRKKGTDLSALYHRLAARRGKKRAIVAVAHRLVSSFYHMLDRQQPYQDLGIDYFDQRTKGLNVDRLLRLLQKLGFSASIEPLAATA
jgi:transposase